MSSHPEHILYTRGLEKHSLPCSHEQSIRIIEHAKGTAYVSKMFWHIEVLSWTYSCPTSLVDAKDVGILLQSIAKYRMGVALECFRVVASTPRSSRLNGFLHRTCRLSDRRGARSGDVGKGSMM